MIPISNVQDFITLFHMIVYFIRLRRLIRERANDNESMELIIILRMIMQVISQWLNLVCVTYQLLNVRLKKRKLVTPFLLIQMLAGYR